MLTVRVTVMCCHHRTLNSTDSAQFSNAMAWFQKKKSIAYPNAPITVSVVSNARRKHYILSLNFWF
jgi:hypothetical protein